VTHLRLLDRDSPLPLYAQVKRRLLQEILAWPSVDDRFHTDQEVCELFGVSRATVRQAFAELEAEGLLRRRQGFGTFVNRQKIEETFSANANFAHQWAQSGRSLKVEPVLCEQVACPEPYAGILNLGRTAEVLYIERYRLSGNSRIAWDRRYIPAGVAAGIARAEFRKVSLLDALKRKGPIERGETQIEAALAGEEYAERLGLMPYEPVLIRHMTYFSADQTPLMTGVSIYRADQVRYKVGMPMQVSGVDVDAEIRVGGAAA
jgi:GntR family transcriptional regulator